MQLKRRGATYSRQTQNPMKKTIYLSLGALLASTALSGATLVAHYKFDEVSGQVAADSAGTAQNLTTSNSGVGWTGGIIGGAVDLTQDVMYAQDAIGNGNNFTISIWVNEAVGQTGYRGIFTTGAAAIDTPGMDDGITGLGEDNWGIDTEDNTNRRGDLRINNNAIGSSDGLDTPVISQGAWVHMALTYEGNGATAVAKAYVNGSLAVTRTSAQNVNLELSYSAGDQYWQLGTDRNNDARRFTGLVDDLAIWSEALSDAEVQNIYDGGLLGIDAPTSVPEPAVSLLGAFGLLGLLRRRR